MKLIIDECISFSTRELLRSLDFELLTIDEILSLGVTDEEICKYASEYEIPILTHDRRFGRIYFESEFYPITIIVLKIVDPHPKATNILLEMALKQIDLNSEHFQDKLILIDVNRIRIRSNPN